MDKKIKNRRRTRPVKRTLALNPQKNTNLGRRNGSNYVPRAKIASN